MTKLTLIEQQKEAVPARAERIDLVFSNHKKCWDALVAPANTLVSDFESKSALEQLAAEAEAEAAAKLNLAEHLSNKPNTPENQKQWLSLIQELEPGPYSSYVIKMIGSLAKETGPVREELLKVQTNWQERYDNNIIYSRDLANLSDALNQHSSMSSWLSSIFKKYLSR